MGGELLAGVLAAAIAVMDKTGARLAIDDRQQARNFTMFLKDHDLEATYILGDGDTKYRGPFRDVLKADDIEIVRIAFSAPKMNGHAESFVGTLKRECLDHFTITGTDDMGHLCQTFATY